MNKKAIKIISIALIFMMIVTISISSFAAGGFSPSQIKANSSVNGTNEIKNVGSSLVGILQTAGIVLSVVILIVLGIKYMLGSSEEKAEYKKTMMPYIIGAALIFAASALAQVIFSFFTGISIN